MTASFATAASAAARWAVASVLAASPLTAQTAISLAPVVTGLPGATDIEHADDGSRRLFIVQQQGVIRIVNSRVLYPAPFLDIREKTLGGGERGLLGLAFPPGFREKQYFFVYYTDRAGNSVVASYRVSGNPDIADAASETVILAFDTVNVLTLNE